jgi:hypothetical protein
MQSTHILTRLKILTSFSIAQRVTEKEIANFYKKHSSQGKSDFEIGELLKYSVLKEVKTALDNNKIPGLISHNEDLVTPNANDPVNKNIDVLNKLVAIIANKLNSKNFDKVSLCYCINTLVNLLGLTEEDFDEFHQKTTGKHPDDITDGTDEEEYYDGEEYDDEDDDDDDRDTPAF